MECFTCFGLAVYIPDQSAEVIVHTVLHHYILIHGTPRKILTDQGKAFQI